MMMSLKDKINYVIENVSNIDDIFKTALFLKLEKEDVAKILFEKGFSLSECVYHANIYKSLKK